MTKKNKNIRSGNKASVAEWLKWVEAQWLKSDLFYGHGSESPADEAYYLLFSLFDWPDKPLEEILLDDSQVEELKRLVQLRLSSKKPLAYLLNKAWFCGMPFYVDERVLVPRSPIAELIHEAFMPWCQPSRVKRVLDLCTGSGCIAIALAKVFEHADVFASDISCEALEVAKINQEAYQLEERVTLVQSDLFNKIKGKFDLIVSNPPYVPEDEWKALPDEFFFEPKLGLVSDSNGLAIPLKILAWAPQFLNPDGVLVLEVGHSYTALEAVCPEVPFLWIDFQSDAEGVCVFTCEELLKYHQFFIAEE